MLRLFGGARYTLCLLPIYYFFIAYGFDSDTSTKPTLRLGFQVLLSLATVLLLSQTASHPLALRDRPFAQANSKESMELYAFLKKNASSGQSIAYRDPRSLWFHAGLQSFASYQYERIDEADYKIFIDTHTKEIADYSKRFQRVFENRRYVVFGPQPVNF